MDRTIYRLMAISVGATLLAAVLLVGGSLALGQASTQALAAVQVPISLQDRRTEATLVVNRTGAKSLAVGKRLYLVIRGLSVESAPGVVYQIYLNLPKDTTPTLNDPHYVGSLNFYNATTASAGRPPVMQSFDVTDQIHRDNRALAGNSTISFIAAKGPAAGSHPRVESIALLQE